MKILITDDHPLFLAGITLVLEQLSDNIEVFEASSFEAAQDMMSRKQGFDLVLLDVELPGVNGIDGIQDLRTASPASPIVILSASESQSDIKRAIEQGAKGYIFKSSSPDVILNALRLVLAGGIYLPMAIFKDESAAFEAIPLMNTNGKILTPRQKEVLGLLVQGKSNKVIARELAIAENTVRVHVASLLKFLNVINRTEAAYEAKKQGFS